MPSRESCARRVGEELVLAVRVQPRSSRNEVLDVRNGRLLIRTTAAPTDGKANKAVVRLVASYLGIAPSRIRLVRGQARRDKLLSITGPVELPSAIAHDPGANGL
jgi:uncharacterized protein (TIGR00251 family)